MWIIPLQLSGEIVVYFGTLIARLHLELKIYSNSIFLRYSLLSLKLRGVYCSIDFESLPMPDLKKLSKIVLCFPFPFFSPSYLYFLSFFCPLPFLRFPPQFLLFFFLFPFFPLLLSFFPTLMKSFPIYFLYNPENISNHQHWISFYMNIYF